MSSNKRRFYLTGVPTCRSPSATKKLKANARDKTQHSASKLIQSDPISSSAHAPSNSKILSPTHEKSIPKVTGHVILGALKGSMNVLLKGCHLFTPLEAAVRGIVDTLEAIECPAEDNHSSFQLLSGLPQWAIVLSAYLSESQPERMSRCVNNVINVLTEEVDYIKSHQQHWVLGNIAKSEKETEELLQCYRRIETSFRQLQTDANLSTWKIADDHSKASRLKEMLPAHDARYDSCFADTINRQGCLGNTRVAVLDSIRQWAANPNDARIYWMNGMAGTGKTAIAYSLCKELEQNGRLGASFFCHRASAECHDVGRILPTVAHQLAQKFYPFRSILCRILEDEPSISRRTISVQFEYLIKLPLQEIRNMLPSGLVVVIDGLDECMDSRTTSTLLELLVEHARALPIRLFLTSRPDPIVSESLDISCQAVQVLHLHDVEVELVKGDIMTYLTVALAKANLSGEQIQILVERAGVFFIYAVTLARYIMGGTPGSISSLRLSSALSGDSGSANKQNRDIHRLYKAILDQVFEDQTLETSEIKTIQSTLWTVACAKEPVAKATLATLLELNVDQIGAALQPLQSVLYVSASKNVVSSLHSSFPEFLFQSELAGSARCDYSSHNKFLATQCFAIMKRKLRYNICTLQAPYTFDSDVRNLPEHVLKSISPELYYACRYWADHLQSSPWCGQLALCLREFLSKQLLFWVEALNLKKSISRGLCVIVEALKWLQNMETSPEILALQDLVRDAYIFTTTFAANPVCQSTPHLYLSALPLTPARNWIRDNYRDHLRGTMCVRGTTLKRREGAALATWETSCGVTAVAYSPDSMRVAYGCHDGSIQVWDTFYAVRTTGRFSGHNKQISTLNFSPDGSRLVSGSRDCNIRMWDANSGACLDLFEGAATQKVDCATLSPDGTRIAAGGSDCTIFMWDLTSGTLIAGPFRGHTKGVTAIAFSSDGSKLASGSYDGTIRLWPGNTPDTANSIKILKGHSAGILSIAFSPNGDYLVSGSLDHTVRIWSSTSGTLFANPFEGHTNAVSAVTFSCDGTRVISGSWDCTVRIWSISDSTQISGPFIGHTQGVTCLSMSPDGRNIVSGSWDGSIHFWDAHSKFLGSPSAQGHTKAITCVQFSSDGDSVISASADSTVCIWDVNTGEYYSNPNASHTGSINSVAFSPDSNFFLTGGDDSMACLWDSKTGTMIGPPLAGHEAGITSVAFSSDGTRFVTGSHDSLILIWDSRNMEVISRLRGHRQSVTSVAFSPNRGYIVSGSWDHTVRLWDANTGVEIAQTSINSETGIGHDDIVTSVTFSPDGTRVASGSYDQTIQIWSTSSSNPSLTRIFQYHSNAAVSVAFSPDSTRLAAGSRDGTIRIWDAQRGILIFDRFSGHTDTIHSIAFAPDGRRIVSGSGDCTIRIWDVPEERNEQGAWGINAEGWLMDPSQRPVLWVPADMRRQFPQPPNSHTFHSMGSIILSPPKVDLTLDEIWH